MQDDFNFEGLKLAYKYYLKLVYTILCVSQLQVEGSKTYRKLKLAYIMLSWATHIFLELSANLGHDRSCHILLTKSVNALMMPVLVKIG